ARLALLPVPRESDFPFRRDGLEITEQGETRVRDRVIRTIEAYEPRSALRVRVRAAAAAAVAAELIAARLAAAAAPPPPAAADQSVVRVYHIAKTQYVRDPRTGHREGRVKDVLDGALDPYLLAYLARRSGAAYDGAAGVTAGGGAAADDEDDGDEAR